MPAAAAANISEDGVFDEERGSNEGALEDAGIFDEESDGPADGVHEEEEDEEEGTPDYAFDEGSDDDRAAAPGTLGLASTQDPRSPALGSSAPAPLSLLSGGPGGGGTGRGLLAATSPESPLFAALSSVSGPRVSGTACWSPRVHPGSHEHVQNLVAERLFGAKPPPAQRRGPDARVVRRLVEPRREPAKSELNFSFRPNVRKNATRKRMDKELEDSMPRWERLAMPNTASALKLEQEQQAKEKKEMAQCTFTPALNESSRKLGILNSTRRFTNLQKRVSEFHQRLSIRQPGTTIEKRRAPPKYKTAVRTKQLQPGLAAYSRTYNGFAPHVGEDFLMDDPVFQELHKQLKALKC